jgi:hypothetical protein
MPFSLASSSPISTNCSGCTMALSSRVLGPVVEVLGQAVGGGRVGELLLLAEGLQVALEHPRGRVADGLGVVGCIGLVPIGVSKARSARGRGLRSCPWGKEARHALGVHDEGPTPSSGAASGRMSGTSAPVQALAVPGTYLRFGVPGLAVLGRRWRGCTGCGGWPARRRPSSGTRPGRWGRRCRAGPSCCPPRSSSRSRSSSRRRWSRRRAAWQSRQLLARP